MVGTAVHPEHEDDPWTVNVGDHPGRTDSPQFVRSRTLMVKLAQQTQPWWFGEKPYQDHHGGGVWLKDADGWLLAFGSAGIEWSAQFCADPAKIDQIRCVTGRLVAGFSGTIAGYEALGYHDAAALLANQVTDADGVQAWTDGIFNASVALPVGLHTGVLPVAAGYHHYPKPVVDIETFKYDDFTLFVTDPQGNPVAVTPVGRRGSGNGAVSVAWADPHTPLGQQKAATDQTGDPLVLPDTHPVAQAAFARQ